MAKGKGVRPDLIERVLAVVSPAAAAHRMTGRVRFDFLQKRFAEYDAASTGRRVANWRAKNSSADAAIAGSLSKIRARSRDLVRNAPFASEAVQVWQDYLVGNGIEPRAATGDEKLDKAVNALWAEWSGVCDADSPAGFHAMTGLAVREMVEGGDCLLRKRPRLREDGLPVPLQVQLLEGDFIDEGVTLSKNVSGGATIRGVEYDSIGRRAGYHLFRQHPGETAIYRSTDSRRVPASELSHLYRRDRTQQRGVPWGAVVMQKLKELDDWHEAELVRKKLEACATGTVTSEDGSSDAMPLTQGATDVSGDYLTDANGQPVEQFEPGLFLYAPPGKSVTFNQPNATGGVEEWNRVQLRIIAAGWGIPYELLTGDLSGVNYSSIRTGLVKFKRRVERLQWQVIIPLVCDPVWRWFVQTAYEAGKISTPNIPVKWTPPKFEAVDRTKEALADLMEMRAGTMTLPQAIAEKGFNPADQLDEIAQYNALLDRLGLILDSDPRKVSRAGLTQARPPGSEIPSGEPGAE